MNKLVQKRIFIPLTKVDAEERLVYGVAAIEQLDKSGQIFDYETSKPLFVKWSAEFAKQSLPAVESFGEDARSFGNLREMHGKVAAGKLSRTLEFDDVAKTISVCAKVIDDAAWKKVRTGVYTGFSIGGQYIKIWDDPSIKVGKHAAERYTAEPVEISIVDNPCMPDATFSYVKALGAVELMKFSSVMITPAQYGIRCEAAKALIRQESEESTKAVYTLVRDAKEAGIDYSDFAKVYLYGEGKPVKKGLYDVSSLAYLLAELNWIRVCLESEAEYEGDGSPIPAQLTDIVAQVSNILVDLAREESAELLPQTQTKGADAAAIKGVGIVKDFLTQHSAAIDKALQSEDAEIKKMASHLKEIGKEVDGIQAAHDKMGKHLETLNPKVDKAKGEEDDEDDREDDEDDKEEKAARALVVKSLKGDLKKSNDRTSALEEQVSNLTKALQALVAKAMPKPVSKFVVNGKAISKQDDTNDDSPLIEVDPKHPDAVKTVIKGILNQAPNMNIGGNR